MAGLSTRRGIFGAHQATFYTRANGVPIVTAKVIKSAGLDFGADYEDLMGGSNLFPWDTEIKKMSGEIKLVLGEYDPTAMALFLGGTLTSNNAEASGAVDGVANVKGTSVISASNGIDTVELTGGDSGDLKEGKYIIVATAATTVDIYALTDVDFKRGNDLVYEDDTLSIKTGVSVASDAAIAEIGVTLSKVGTPNFTTGDTAEFYIRKPNTGSMELLIGGNGSEFEECGCLLVAQKQSGGHITMLDIYKCKGAGMPINLNAGSYSEASISMKALYDSDRDAVAKFMRTLSA
jgi:hypothetical protein